MQVRQLKEELVALDRDEAVAHAEEVQAAVDHRATPARHTDDRIVRRVVGGHTLPQDDAARS
jgi:hypothetical protein